MLLCHEKKIHQPGSGGDCTRFWIKSLRRCKTGCLSSSIVQGVLAQTGKLRQAKVMPALGVRQPSKRRARALAGNSRMLGDHSYELLETQPLGMFRQRYQIESITLAVGRQVSTELITVR